MYPSTLVGTVYGTMLTTKRNTIQIIHF